MVNSPQKQMEMSLGIRKVTHMKRFRICSIQIKILAPVANFKSNNNNNYLVLNKTNCLLHSSFRILISIIQFHRLTQNNRINTTIMSNNPTNILHNLPLEFFLHPSEIEKNVASKTLYLQHDRLLIFILDYSAIDTVVLSQLKVHLR